MRNLVGKADSMAKYSFLRVHEKREKSDEPWASWESLSKISVFLHKVCVNSFLYLRIGFLGEEISL